MNYTPETKWVGGKYPGALPAHKHYAVDVEKRIRERSLKPAPGVPLTPTVTLILDAVRSNAPVTLKQLAAHVERSTKTVYARLSILERAGKITKERCKNTHNHQRSFFYSGVQ